MSNALAGIDRSGVRSSDTPQQSRRASCACWGIGCVKPGACGGAIIIATRLVGGSQIMGQSMKLLGSYQLPRDACRRVIHIGRLIAKCNQIWKDTSRLGSIQVKQLGCDGGRQVKSNEGLRCSMNATLRGRFLIRSTVQT